ncbi:MAG: hypothetical protein ABJL18_02065 [Hyphomicrobiales bacterium]
MKQWISSSKPLKALIRPLLKNPLEHDLMEFKYGLWSGVSSLFDEDERQLGEGNVSPMIFNHDIPTDVHSCKFSGSRDGKLINMSSLRSTMKYFYEASAITVAIRDYHMEQINKPINENPNIWDLYVIARASLALIAYRYRSENRPITDRMPNDLGSQYKMVTGIYVICREMVSAAHPAIKNNDSISAQELYDYADKHNLFESDTGMVCAGSARKIVEFLELAIQGRNHPEGAKLKLEKQGDHLDVLGRYAPDIKGWYSYAMLTIELDSFILMEVLERKLEANPSGKERIQSVIDIIRAQHSYWLELLERSDEPNTADFKQGALERQNAILTHLKKPPVKAISNKVFNARLHDKNQTEIAQ